MGGGGKGGGGYDPGPMLEYGDRALDLQEKIYKDQRADAQPWYKTGSSAVDQLGMLMGLNSGSQKTAQDFRTQLAPQYTTTTNNQGNTGQYVNRQGQVFSLTPDQYKQIKQNPGRTATQQYAGLKAYSPSTSSSSVDNAGLDAAVNQALADQQASNQSTNPLFGSLAKSFSLSDFETDPGYGFRLGEGEKALQRKLNASGKTYSPEAAKALMEYNQNFGSNEYNNAYNRYNINQDNLFNRLATLSGFGQTASGQIANAGANYGNSASDLLTGMGNTITASNIAKANNRTSMFNTGIGGLANMGASWLGK